MAANSDVSLQDDAMRLAELDRRLVRAVVEANAEEVAATIETYISLRKSLQARMLDESAVTVEDGDAAQVLRKISTGDGLPSDNVIKQLWAGISEGDEFHEFDQQEIQRLGSEIFYSWFSHHEYITGLAELRPLILRGSVAGPVSQLVHQVKQCYAFQQYDAAYALCRMVIEASVRDICVRRHLFRDLGANVPLLENVRWRDLSNRVSSGLIQNRLDRLYSSLSVLMHSRKTVTQAEAREAFEETLQVIELLYQEHGL